MRCRAHAAALVALVALVALEALGRTRDAWAEPVTFRADALDADGEVLVLAGHVVVGVGRLRATSERVELRRDAGGVTIDGTTHVAPCPCADPPVAIGVSSARFRVDGDVTVTLPRLEIEGVAVFALPWLWLRAPGKPGLLPPILELRGDDGALLGGGALLPFTGGTLRLTAAGYTTGGVEISTRVETQEASTRIVFDERAGERGGVDARGAHAFGATTVAWDVDALRGSRAIGLTPDLFDATRPFDTGAAEVARAARWGAATLTASAGVVGRADRGEGALVAGPRAGAGFGTSLGAFGALDARVGASILGSSRDATPIVAAGDGAPITLADGNVNLAIAPHLAPFDAAIAIAARGGIAGVDASASREGAAGASATLGLPFLRRFGEGEDAPTHVVTPTLEAAAAIGGRAAGDVDFWLPLVAPPPSSAWVVGAGLTTALGDAANAVKLEARGGAVGFAGDDVTAMTSGRLTASTAWAAVATSAAAIAPRGATTGGATWLGRLRVGALTTAHLGLEIAAQSGAGAADARVLEAGLLVAPRYAELAHPAGSAPVDGDGWTGAIEAHLPLPRDVALRARVDADLGAPALLAASGGVRIEGRCRCFAIDLGAGHRLGRGGLDGSFAFELAP